MRIDTMTPEMAVHVTPSDQTIELGMGEPRAAGSSVARLSVPQAEMVLHALGLAIAQIKETERRAAEERRRLAQVVAETEVHRR
jgi:hypothetical protein